ncbi:MAG: PD40 domain-containing protein [Candidatus Eisenbacteria bacterium]|nr:PD40 domain-containing protein [Candidatus Eisenbacteria bacterium]
MRWMRAALPALLAAIVFLVPRPAAPQGFGKNKVQYENLQWAVLETPHVRLHYYAEEESLARRLVAFAESVCVEYDGRFHLAPRHHVPILLYSAHHLFQQTNATPEYITEAVGGLTELVKGRVLIPHNGSWTRLAWVTRHELTHWYMIEKITHVMHQHHRNQPYMPPLWYIEGLAEYCGTHWDEDAEGLLRDAVMSGEALPITHSEPIWGSVLMYKEGQSFLLHVRDTYGDSRVFEILDNWWRADDFETAFRITLGLPVERVDEEWFESLKRRYYPVAAIAHQPQEVARRLTPHGRFNLGPRAMRDGDGADSTLAFCWFEAGENGIHLMLSEPRKGGGRHERRLLSGGQSPTYESFHLFQNRPQVSSQGHIVLSAKHGGRDALIVLDSRHGGVLRHLEFPRLVAIHDPCLVPGDSAIVFTAQDYSGRSDLFRASWPRDTVRLERLTDDDYDDLEPDVSPDGRWVVFASDRADRGGRYALFRLSLAGGSPEALSEPPRGDDRQPVYSPDGRWIAFRSTRGGTSDLWLRPSEPAREARRVTRMIGPASDPDWLPHGRGLLFTAQNAITFQTYAMHFAPESLTVEREGPGLAAPALATFHHDGHALPYERHLSLDLVQNAVALDPVLGTSAAAQIAVSDVLGNEQYQIFLANDSGRFGGSFWDGLEGSVTYLNQAQRLNYGVGVFRLTELYDVDLDLVRREQRVGVLGLVSYPFDRFDRIEASVVVRHADNHLLRSGGFRDENLLSDFLTLVHDNVGWTGQGPSLGTRMFVSGGFTRDLTYAQGDYVSMLGEIRHYEMPLPLVVWASRVQAYTSSGRDAQRFYLGGYGSIEGYQRRALSGPQTLLVQEEVRTPLLRNLTIAAPAPWMLPPIGGAVFIASAWAWQGGFQDRVGSAGFGIYIGGGYFPAFRWDFAWLTSEFHHYSHRPHTQFWIGYNF